MSHRFKSLYQLASEHQAAVLSKNQKSIVQRTTLTWSKRWVLLGRIFLRWYMQWGSARNLVMWCTFARGSKTSFNTSIPLDGCLLRCWWATRPLVTRQTTSLSLSSTTTSLNKWQLENQFDLILIWFEAHIYQDDTILQNKSEIYWINEHISDASLNTLVLVVDGLNP